MDTFENPPSLSITEGAPTISSELVTISRAELDDLLLRAETSSMGSSPEPCRKPGSPHDANGLATDESKTSVRSRDVNFARELTERDNRVAALERACKTAVRERELATILAGKPLVAGAAAQLIKLWRDDFDVFEEDAAYTVTARDGRPVAEVVSELLGSTEYSHFCLATSRGGTGARGGSRPHDAVVNTARPKNLGEAIVMKWREESAAQPDNLLKPIGLRRHR
jgi:hypothetical protein